MFTDSFHLICVLYVHFPVLHFIYGAFPRTRVSLCRHHSPRCDVTDRNLMVTLIKVTCAYLLPQMQLVERRKQNRWTLYHKRGHVVKPTSDVFFYLFYSKTHLC